MITWSRKHSFSYAHFLKKCVIASIFNYLFKSVRSALSIVKSAKISLANIFKVEYNQGNLFYYLGSPSMMRPRTATIGSVSFQVNKKRSHQENPANDGENTPPTRKTSLFDSFRPRSKSDATRKLSHRRVPIVSRNFYLWKFDTYLNVFSPNWSKEVLTRG